MSNMHEIHDEDSNLLVAVCGYIEKIKKITREYSENLIISENNLRVIDAVYDFISQFDDEDVDIKQALLSTFSDKMNDLRIALQELNKSLNGYKNKITTHLKEIAHETKKSI